MTKSTGAGRGGSRKGAGRKPKQGVTLAKVERAVEQAVAVVSSAASPAKQLLDLAYTTLADVMINSPFPAPRVTAARAVIDIVKAEEAVVEGAEAPDGKKGRAAASASKVASAGKFASPSAPKLVVSNP